MVIAISAQQPIRKMGGAARAATSSVAGTPWYLDEVFVFVNGRRMYRRGASTAKALPERPLRQVRHGGSLRALPPSSTGRLPASSPVPISAIRPPRITMSTAGLPIGRTLRMNKSNPLMSGQDHRVPRALHPCWSAALRCAKRHLSACLQHFYLSSWPGSLRWSSFSVGVWPALGPVVCRAGRKRRTPCLVRATAFGAGGLYPSGYCHTNRLHDA